MTRNTLLSALICLNLILATALFIAAAPMPAAHAQGTGLAGNYLVVAGQVRSQFDALYLIDMRVRILHGILYDRTSRRLVWADSIDLERDFRHNR